jgi:hypothetical protein
VEVEWRKSTKGKCSRAILALDGEAGEAALKKQLGVAELNVFRVVRKFASIIDGEAVEVVDADSLPATELTAAAPSPSPPKPPPPAPLPPPPPPPILLAAAATSRSTAAADLIIVPPAFLAPQPAPVPSELVATELPPGLTAMLQRRAGGRVPVVAAYAPRFCKETTAESDLPQFLPAAVLNVAEIARLPRRRIEI